MRKKPVLANDPSAPARRRRPAGRRLAAVLAALPAAALLLAPAGGRAQQIPNSVADDSLRVCADPANMPFSDRKEAGFENRIAGIVADELKVPVRYYWMPQGPGFVRNSLSMRLCDVVIGYAAGADPVLHTNPYYTSVYVLVVKADGPLATVDSLADPRLKGHKLGVVAATPPADHLLAAGLLADAKTYSLLVDRRFESPGEAMIADLKGGVIDGALLWGPTGGYFAKQAGPGLKAIPLVKDTERPDLSYRITAGVRPTDHDWKQTLNLILRKRQADIDKVLLDYGVPLLDDENQVITAAAPPQPGPSQPGQPQPGRAP